MRALQRQDRLDEALFFAIKTGILEKVKQALLNGADPNAFYAYPHQNCQERYQSPMSYAASKGSLEIVRLLLEKGSRLVGGEHPKAGLMVDSPIHFAVEAGHLPIVNFLHENGVDINACDKDLVCQCHSSDLLIQAASNEHLEIVRWLLQHGKTIDPIEIGMVMGVAITLGDLDTLKALKAREVDLGQPIEDRCCALCAAVYEENFSIFEWLCENGLEAYCSLAFAVHLKQNEFAKYLLQQLSGNGLHLENLFDESKNYASRDFDDFKGVINFALLIYPFCFLSSEKKFNVELAFKFSTFLQSEVLSKPILTSRMFFSKAFECLFEEKPDLKRVAYNFLRGLFFSSKSDLNEINRVLTLSFEMAGNNEHLLNNFIKAFLVFPCNESINERNLILDMAAQLLHENFKRTQREDSLILSMLCLLKNGTSKTDFIYLSNLSDLIEWHTKEKAIGMTSSTLIENHSVQLLGLLDRLEKYYENYSKDLLSGEKIAKEKKLIFNHLRGSVEKKHDLKLNASREKPAKKNRTHADFFSETVKRSKVKEFAPRQCEKGGKSNSREPSPARLH